MKVTIDLETLAAIARECHEDINNEVRSAMDEATTLEECLGRVGPALELDILMSRAVVGRTLVKYLKGMVLIPDKG